MSLPYIPNMGIGSMYSPIKIPQGNPGYTNGDPSLAPPPTMDRTQYTGSFVDPGYGAIGDQNNKIPGQGPQIMPSGDSRQFSQLGGWRVGDFAGTYPAGQLYGNPAPGPAPITAGYQMQYPGQSGGQPAAPQQGGGRVAPKAPEPGRMSWAGGIGTSDNSAWGNALGPSYEKSVGGGPLQTSAYQPQGHTNQALPPGYGSAFGLGGTK